ncbi:MAG: sugar nucleotide-binding protein [Puniceicoccales bacterium]|nr:sugar nucleotide-binding protein [Puniceicoccales bacterium]
MVILLGASGYVGQAYARYLSAENIAFAGVSRRDVDYGRVDVLADFLGAARAEFVINAAGYTGKPNVDACEAHRAECLRGNAVLPGVVREACARVRVPWGHVSSGCIFSGTRPDGSGFRETDAPNFSFRKNLCSFYSGAKALGEEVLGYGEAVDATVDGAEAGGGARWVFREGEPEGFIWRLRIPFENVESPRNYLAKLMCYKLLLDAENSLSQLHEFVRATVECWRRRAPFGIYNVTNPGRVTTREVVDLIVRSGVCPKEYVFFKDEAEFMHLAAKTPRSNCVLDTSKLRHAGIAMTEVHDALAQALRHWVRA